MSLIAQITLPSGISYEQPTGIFYNNEFHPSKSGKTFATLNPATAEEITQVCESEEADIDAAVSSAKTCFETLMEDITPADRAEMLLKFASAIEADRDVIAAIESMDGGKPLTSANSDDVGEVLNVFRYYAGWADKVQGKTMDTGKNRLAYTVHEPIGVCGQVIPWNFPLAMFAWKVAPAFACGNTVVLKPAEQTPLSVLYLASLMKDIFPPGAINICPGFGKTAGAPLVSHPDVRKVAFTGSTLVGRQILKMTADSAILKKVTLELGGKSPLVVLEDADLEQAAKWAHMGMFYNQSQVCCATTRVLVQSSVYENFAELFVKQTRENNVVGKPEDKDTFQGPQISKLQYDKILNYIEVGKSEGAHVLLDGGKADEELGKGYFIKPTIFGEVKSSMRIAQEEIFGPVVSLSTFETFEEGIRMANDTSYGLGASIFTRDIRKGHQAARKLQAGQVWINSSGDGAPSIPFGGFKNSGIGRELGEYALSNYCEVKAVMVNLGVDL